MTSHFTLTLDTAPPASPLLDINDGASRTGDPVVSLKVSSASADTREMKIWGDLDTTVDGRFQTLEGDSQWTLWSPEVIVRLTAGTGRKYLYARLRDDVMNETVAFTDWIDLDLDSPVVAITSPPNRSRISNHPPLDSVLFAWSANRPFVHYEVRVVPSTGSPFGAGVLLGSASGSTHVSGTGSFDAGSPISTTIEGLDLQAASPGDSSKIIKVFVQDAGGVWSS